jgi:sugar phosphate isomerase/epimerase
LEENLKSFLPVVDACEKHGVTLGIENLMKYPHAHPSFYSYIVEDQCELIDKLGSKKAGAVWDFGHANIVDEDHAQAKIKFCIKIDKQYCF